ncbi:MAG: serine/threonine-protein phosphatase [Planctomycetes bacterium]|nr:serine/threonine-protein phosphatase [Planctomycetota bacterium]
MLGDFKLGQSASVIEPAAGYEINALADEPWLHITIRGRYHHRLLDVLRAQALPPRRSLAIDAGGLMDPTPLLVRELMFLAGSLKAARRRLVLITPPEALLALFPAGGRLPAFPDFDSLPADPRRAEECSAHLEKEFEKIRSLLLGEPLWQLYRDDASWLCPFCADFVEIAGMRTNGSVPSQTVESIRRHFRRSRGTCGLAAESRKPPTELLAKMEPQPSLGGAGAAGTASSVLPPPRRAEASEPPSFTNADLGVLHLPGTAEGGAFYEILRMRGGRTGLLIGDIEARGIEASVLSGMIRKAAAIRAADQYNPEPVLRQLNRDMYADLHPYRALVSAFLAVYDAAGRTLNCACAGHPPPILFNRRRSPFPCRLAGGGIRVGLSSGALFDRALQKHALALETADVLLLYTAGVEAASHPSGQTFGAGRCSSPLETEHDRSASHILEALSRSLALFRDTAPLKETAVALCLKIYEKPV